MSDKCPYCYRPLSTWKKNPILLPGGSKYKWSDDTHLVEVPNIVDRIYKGFYQIGEDEVIEIQDNLKTLEEEHLSEINRTIFSPLNDSGLFQITGKHIKEMRDSVEKLLDEVGLTKIEYFNYDEDENHIIHPNGDKTEWTDPITLATDLKNFQIKAIHIEDLRHYIREVIEEIWRERWIASTDFHASGSKPGPMGFTEDYQNNFTGDEQGEYGWAVFAYSNLAAQSTCSWDINMFHKNLYIETELKQDGVGEIQISKQGTKLETGNIFNPEFYFKRNGILNTKQIFYTRSVSFIHSSSTIGGGATVRSTYSTLFTISFWNELGPTTTRTLELYQGSAASNNILNPWGSSLCFRGNLSSAEKISIDYYPVKDAWDDFNYYNLTNAISNNFSSLLASKQHCRIGNLRMGIATSVMTNDVTDVARIKLNIHYDNLRLFEQ